MNRRLAIFLLGSWSGIGLIAWLIVWPTAWGAGLEHSWIILPVVSFAVIRMIELRFKRTPLDVIRHGG